MSGGSRFVVQLRVLFALLMREMTTRFGRSSGGYVWAVLEPVGVVAVLSLVFVQIARTPSLGDSFPLFFAIGYLVYQTWRDIANQLGTAVRVNRPLLAFPRVTLMDTLLARFALQIVTSIFVATLVLGALIAFDGERISLDIAPVALTLALTALLGLGVGTFNAVMFVYFSAYERVYNIVTRPLMLISGIFFIFEDMPSGVQDVLWWNPIIHLTGLFRTGFYPSYEAAYVSIVYVFTIALAHLFFGALLLRALKSEILEL